MFDAAVSDNMKLFIRASVARFVFLRGWWIMRLMNEMVLSEVNGEEDGGLVV